MDEYKVNRSFKKKKNLVRGVKIIFNKIATLLALQLSRCIPLLMRCPNDEWIAESAVLRILVCPPSLPYQPPESILYIYIRVQFVFIHI